MTVLDVVTPGALTTVQDRGRPGHAALGVGESGAADQPSFALANRLVGNHEDAACLEVTFGGLAVRPARPGHLIVAALTGAPCPATIDGHDADMNTPLHLPAGSTLRLGTPQAGLRTYLAVRGGVDTATTLGSRSADLLSGLGPDPLTAGQQLPVGHRIAGDVPPVDIAPTPAPPAGDHVTLRLTPGPRDDWFTPEALRTLTSAAYEITSESNRIGMRLAGPALERSRDGELPSEAMVTGALQVPPSGQPVLFLADHPVTGGYPVIGVTVAADVPIAAQTRPGQRLRFQLATPPPLATAAPRLTRPEDFEHPASRPEEKP